MIAPKHNGEFVAHMEDVLELYQEPYDPDAPVVCMDEASKQLVGETRVPVPAAPGRPARVDYEYERKGTANIFIFTEPLLGWRSTQVTEQRTRIDWALAVKELLDVHYPDVRVVRLVMDNLNTHSIGSLYEAFKPPRPAACRSVWRSTTRQSTAVGSTSRRSNCRCFRANAWIAGSRTGPNSIARSKRGPTSATPRSSVSIGSSQPRTPAPG